MPNWSRLTLPFSSGILVLLAATTGLAQSTRSDDGTFSHVHDEQTLRPGDYIQLKIWREDDHSGRFQVDEHGTVVFPLLGPMNVTDMAPTELKNRLIDAYRVYFTHDVIEVVFLRRVTIRGAVRDPGLYPVDPTMTVADMLALAGGATPQGEANKVELVRDGVTITANLEEHDVLGEFAVQSGDQFFVPERSWISRNSNIVSAIITAAVSLLIAFR